jgi:hypothetical protein
MKKILTKAAIVFVMTLIAIILTPIIILNMPIKHVEMQVNTTEGPVKELVKDEFTQIYVDSHPESPGWIIYGKDGVIFKGINKANQIFIVGDFPKKMNYDLINNRFVLNGKYIGMKKRKGVIAGCFYVESWGVLGKLRRENGAFDYLSKSSLTVLDNIFADPIFVYDLSELKDLDDSEVSK